MADDRRCHSCTHRVALEQTDEDESTFRYRPRRDPDQVEALVKAVRATYLLTGPKLVDAWREVQSIVGEFDVEDDPPHV